MTLRYPEWLMFVFDRPETPNGWYFDVEYDEFDAPLEQIAELIALTMENCGKDLACYSDAQVAHGLTYIFNNSCSDVVFALIEDSVSTSLRLRGITSLKILYRDCLAPRCAPVLGHIDEPGANPLNYPCYMLWDFSPLSYWENRPNREIFYSAVVDVLEDALLSSNPACVESALHGLGHILSNYHDRVSQAISDYQQRNDHLSPALILYAQNASTGCIQ